MKSKTARHLARRLSKDQRGITGLETAIVLVAFVLVASVFAYAVLNTGLFASDRSKQSVTAGLKQTESTIETRGAVIAEADSTTDHVYQVHVVLANAPGGDPISLAATDVVVSYSDKDQVANLASSTWSTTWLVGDNTNSMLDPGDVVEMVINLDGLTTQLEANTTFQLEIKPKIGAVVSVNRATPSAIAKVMNLN